MTKKPPTIDQLIAQGEVCHDAYSELVPVVQELMLGRELSKEAGAVVLAMVVTSFYQGKDLDQFVDTIAQLAVFRQAWDQKK
jgi:hypothetical protein